MQLSYTYNLQGGHTAFAAHVMGNFNSVATLVNGQLNHDNFGTLTGGLSWNIASASQRALTITTAATVGAVAITQAALLGVDKAALEVKSTLAQGAAGAALTKLVLSSPSAAVPTLLVENEGSGPPLKLVSTRAGAVNAPKLTSAQRNAVDAPEEGMEIWNSTLKRKEVYDGTHWVDATGQTGQIVDFAGDVLPGYLLECDGSAVSRTTYAALFAKVGTTWGSGDGSTTFNLPDLRGRTTIGAGQGAGLTNRTLGQSLGAETHTLTTAQMPAHSHSGASASHAHDTPVSEGGGGYYVATQFGGGGIQGSGLKSPLPGVTNVGLTQLLRTSGPSDSSTGSSGSGQAHNIMQPSAVVRKCIVI